MIRLLLCLAAVSAFGQDPDFSYPAKPLDVRVLQTEKQSGAEIRDLTFAGANGKRIAAFLVLPSGTASAAGTLYVHWYDSAEPTSNRYEFLDEAIAMARHGMISLLPETMWSDPNWYPSRVQADDFKNSVEQVKDLRRALDVLTAEPRVDKDRIALVGHDFGGMYGVVTAAVDSRIKAFTLMASTTSFSDWYTYGKFRLEGEAREKYVAQMAPLDPVAHIAKLKVPVLMQFANFDFYVPRDKINAFRKAVAKPNPLWLYEAGHGLDWQAERDRKAFLIDKLHLSMESTDIIHAYFQARNEGDPVKIEAFHSADFRETFLGQPGGDLAERKKYYEFDEAVHGHFEYRFVETAKDS
ncbi:MAG: prolyl oligopeptidase family serine peptidase, partial [Bryobacteraceae bacterium]